MAKVTKVEPSVLEMIQTRFPGYHPLMSLAEMAHRQNISPEIEFQCHKTIAEFITPKLKSVEIKANDDRRRVTISMFGDDPDDLIEDVETVEVLSGGHNLDLITVK